jgi:hypothetical protein
MLSLHTSQGHDCSNIDGGITFCSCQSKASILWVAFEHRPTAAQRSSSDAHASQTGASNHLFMVPPLCFKVVKKYRRGLGLCFDIPSEPGFGHSSGAQPCHPLHDTGASAARNSTLHDRRPAHTNAVYQFTSLGEGWARLRAACICCSL